MPEDNNNMNRSFGPDPTSLTTAQLLRELTSLRELVFTRIDAMDKAVELVSTNQNRTPTEMEKQIGAQRQIMDERFISVAQRFEERDVRTAQASSASDQALNAALQAAKELVNAQGEASAAAAVKSETSFTKQIDQIGTIISTLEKALDARITELKERIDRGEGQDRGAAGAITEKRLDSAQIIQMVMMFAAIITVVVLVALHL